MGILQIAQVANSTVSSMRQEVVGDPTGGLIFVFGFFLLFLIIGAVVAAVFLASVALVVLSLVGTFLVCTGIGTASWLFDLVQSYRSGRGMTEFKYYLAD